MKKNIHYLSLKLIKNLLILLFIASCISYQAKKTYTLITPNGDEINLQLAITEKEQTTGLSGRKIDTFFKNDGMLFVYKDLNFRSFWMPDTYFDLDIVFLDPNFIITEIARDIPHHPGYLEPPKIARLPQHKAQFVLEMRSDSEIVKSLKIGNKLKWKLASDLEEILKDTRQQQ